METRGLSETSPFKVINFLPSVLLNFTDLLSPQNLPTTLKNQVQYSLFSSICLLASFQTVVAIK